MMALSAVATSWMASDAASASEDDSAPKRPPFVHVDAIHFQGHWYMWFNETVPFETAMSRARKMKGNLLMIESDAVNTFVAGHTKVPTWLGAKRPRNRQWVGQGGKVVFGYSNWAPGQPQNGAGENYAAIHPDGTWHDYLPSRLGYCIEWRGAPRD
jgi:hypothetical protein